MLLFAWVCVDLRNLISIYFFFLEQCTVDKLLKDTDLAGVIGTHSWKEQFMEALTVSAGKY